MLELPRRALLLLVCAARVTRRSASRRDIAEFARRGRLRQAKAYGNLDSRDDAGGGALPRHTDAALIQARARRRALEISVRCAISLCGSPALSASPINKLA